MKTKLVLWGTNAQEERVLVALELLPKQNKVNVYEFPETVATEAFYQQIMDDWRNGKDMEFPEGNYTKTEQELTITDSVLPEYLKVERGDLVQRAQAEWHFVVLSAKLSDAYHSELAEIRDRIDRLDSFDDDLWNSLKDFWDKVQLQVKDRNLFRDHANNLRNKTNELFGKMKELRNKLDEQYKESSRANVDRFMAKLEEIEQKISDGLRFQNIFDELKDLQRKFRSADFTREHRAKVWDRIDASFKTAKERRFGSTTGSSDEKSPVDRLKRRYDGLISAMGKMKRSIERDEEELAFQNQRIASTDGQLEAQIRQAKILMIEERIRSKQEKYNEMERTKTDLESRMESAKVKEAKRKEQEMLEEAKRKAQEKIAGEIKEAAEARSEDDEKLEKAAEALTQKAAPAPEVPEAEAEASATEEEKPEDEESLLDAVGTTVGEVVEDAVDTFKAIASVVGGQIGEALDDLKGKLKEKNKAEEEE